MTYKVMSTEDLTLELTKKYYPMLSPQRKIKINELEDPEERAVLFCSEILARQCLSELLNAPEYSFDVLCNPDSISIVGNYNVSCSVVRSGKYIGCACSKDKAGIGLVPVEPFPFRDAQQYFSDSEIRAIFSDSVYSFTEIVRSKECSEKQVMQRYAVFYALKEAVFRSTGRGIKPDFRKYEFSFRDNKLICSDRECIIEAAYVDKRYSLAVAVTERK